MITNGPVPIGKSRKSGLLAETGSSLKACDGRMLPLTPPTNGSNQEADGAAKFTTAVRSSGVSTLSITDQTVVDTEALSGLVIHSQVNRMSFDVSGVPSLQRMPSWSLKVTEERSSASRPFSTDGVSVIRHGMIVPSGR